MHVISTGEPDQESCPLCRPNTTRTTYFVNYEYIWGGKGLCNYYTMSFDGFRTGQGHFCLFALDVHLHFHNSFTTTRFISCGYIFEFLFQSLFYIAPDPDGATTTTRLTNRLLRSEY